MLPTHGKRPHMENNVMQGKNRYETKYVPQMQRSRKMGGCCEQCCKCQIHGRIQDQVFRKTATQQPPPLITLSIENSDANIMYEDIETLSLMCSYPASDLALLLFWASIVILLSIPRDPDRRCISLWDPQMNQVQRRKLSVGKEKQLLFPFQFHLCL